MTDSSTPEGTGLTEAQAAERLFARYQSDEDHGEGETRGEEPQPDEADADPVDDPEQGESEGEADAEPDDPDADPEEPEGEPETSQTFKVKVDGEEVEVPLDELLKGYSRTQDYTRKTQAIAEERKSLEGEKAATAATRAEYASRLEVVEKALNSFEPKVDQSLRTTNPAEWSAQMLQHRAWADQKQAVAAERQAIAAQEQREEAEQRARVIQQEQERLAEALPEWKDPEVRKAEESRLIDYALRAGLSEDEINEIVDHRVVVTLRKAMLYDEIKSKAPETRARVDAVKTAKPGAKPVTSRATEEKRARERLVRDGSTEAAVDLLLSRSRQRRA